MFTRAFLFLIVLYFDIVSAVSLYVSSNLLQRLGKIKNLFTPYGIDINFDIFTLLLSMKISLITLIFTLILTAVIMFNILRENRKKECSTCRKVVPWKSS